VPNGGFTGNVMLTAAVTSSPAGAVDLPTFGFGNTSPVNITSTNAVSATLTVTTTAPSSSAMARPARSRGILGAAGGAALASLALIVFPMRRIPIRRRGARSLLGMMVFLFVAMAAIAACGGGSSGGGGGGGQSIPGTTAGNYTVTVTATSGSTIATGAVALTVE
jgi:trimeric autotransporter adhesin